MTAGCVHAGLMCSGVGFQQATADAGGTAPDALHRLARRAPLTEVPGVVGFFITQCLLLIG